MKEWVKLEGICTGLREDRYSRHREFWADFIFWNGQHHDTQPQRVRPLQWERCSEEYAEIRLFGKSLYTVWSADDDLEFKNRDDMRYHLKTKKFQYGRQ